MNEEPQVSTTTSAARPNVENLRSPSESSIPIFGTTDRETRVEPRRENSDGYLGRRAAYERVGIRPSVSSNLPRNNATNSSTGLASQPSIPPRTYSLGSNPDFARDEARRKAQSLMLTQRREAENRVLASRRATGVTTDLTTPPRRHTTSLSSHPIRDRPEFPMPSTAARNNIHRQQDQPRPEYPLPRWQPDSEVSECPICKQRFTFLFRRHHCRKCGRVVCANCSPHRITIPKQYIVNPPPIHPLEIDLTDDSTQDEDSAARLASDQLRTSLDGGQEVRLCNPCVPDPNPLPPPSYTSFQSANSGYNPYVPRPVPPSGRRRSHHAHHFVEPSLFGSLQTDSSTASRAQQIPPYQSVSTTPFGSAPNAANTQLPRYMNSRFHRPNASLSVLPSARQRAMFEAMTSIAAPPPEPPRPQIAEEDECPICHEELPPRGPDGSEHDREAHIAGCIDGHFSSSRPKDSIVPRNETAAVATTSASGSVRTGTSMPNPTIAGPSTRRRTTGMVVYNATEKDCMGEDGAAQECIICFEDFEPGSEMGRLECLCKFHKSCIRSWWDKKGAGSCPVHQGGLI